MPNHCHAAPASDRKDGTERSRSPGCTSKRQRGAEASVLTICALRGTFGVQVRQGWLEEEKVRPKATPKEVPPVQPCELPQRIGMKAKGSATCDRASLRPGRSATKRVSASRPGRCVDADQRSETLHDQRRLPVGSAFPSPAPTEPTPRRPRRRFSLLRRAALLDQSSQDHPLIGGG